MKRIWFIALATLLSACGSTPSSYLPQGRDPIVNVELPLSEQLCVNAAPAQLTLQNLTTSRLDIAYKLFWYNQEGVTQTLDTRERTPWQTLWLAPNAKTDIPLTKPTQESVNYRVYLRGNR